MAINIVAAVNDPDPTVEYHPLWEIHTMTIPGGARWHFRTSELARLYYEIEGSLRHAYEEEGAAANDAKEWAYGHDCEEN